jgi:hypothetical protein
LLQVAEDELENLEPENEGVVFVITTGVSQYYKTSFSFLAEATRHD